MSVLRVDTIYNRAKTASPAIGVRPDLNDDSTKAVDSGWVQLELDDLLTQTRTVSGDWTFSGTTIISGDTTISGSTTLSGDTTISGTPTFSGLPIFPVSMGVYTTVGKSTGSFAMTYESGNTHSPSKNETGSTTFTLTFAMSDVNQYVVLANAYGVSEDVQPNCEITINSASSFTIVVEKDSGANVDAEVRFMVFGVKA